MPAPLLNCSRVRDDPTIVHIEALVTYTADDGEELYASISGELATLTGSITATVTYDGGTGRFSDATGTARLLGQFQEDGTIAVTVRGSIDY